MQSLLILTIGSTTMAYLSQKYYGNGIKKNGKVRWDIFLVLLTVGAVLFSGLRTEYNDTWAYRTSFQNAEPVSVFLANPKNREILRNPLFYFLESWIREQTDNYHIFLMLFAAFDVTVLIWFIRKYSGKNFPYAILYFFCIGTYMFGMGAIKQTTAMAIICVAVDKMLQKKWVAYYLLVFIAGLMHTYAFMFLLIPFIADKKPWGWKIFLLCGLTFVVLMTFESTISKVLEFADQAGKTVASYEVFDGKQMNVFRVGVYGIVPLFSLAAYKLIVKQMDATKSLFIDFSVISFMFMLLASMNGANMFGRLARYFVTYGVIVLPWIIDQVIAKNSAKWIKVLASFLFVAFYLYDIKDYQRYAISIFEFLESLL